MQCGKSVITYRDIILMSEITESNKDLDLTQKLDAFEAAICSHPQVKAPLTHRFTNGMYIREILMPANTIVMSRVHKTQHPFVISKGDVSVFTPGAGCVRLKAPHTGITEPGTRRVLLTHEDTIWTTFHVTETTDLDDLVEELTEHDNPLIPEGFVDAAFDKPEILEVA